jgi:hypothetical protein
VLVHWRFTMSSVSTLAAYAALADARWIVSFRRTPDLHGARRQDWHTDQASGCIGRSTGISTRASG